MSSTVAKSLSRLSRERLIDLCISWSKSSYCSPYLASNRDALEIDEEDYLHEPVESRHELRSIYRAFQHTGEDLHDLSKRDIIDRIVDGDWRRGLSHQQLALIDFASLEEHDTSLRWSALKLVPLTSDVSENTAGRPSKRRKVEVKSVAVMPEYPDATAAIFVQNLKAQISPLVKARYHIHKLVELGLSIVRLYITPNRPFAPLSANIPYQGKTATDSARIMYIALPDSCPYVYVSISGSSPAPQHQRKTGRGKAKAVAKVDTAATKRIILEAIPKALSRPQQRWSLQPTKLTAKSLQSMTLLRGSGKVGASGGTLSRLIQLKPAQNEILHCGREASETTQEEQQEINHSRNVQQKFGIVEGSCHAKLDRVQVRVQDLSTVSSKASKKRKEMDEAEEYQPSPLTLTMSGADVFAGLKQFALMYPTLIDLQRLPAVMTGEGGVTAITI